MRQRLPRSFFVKVNGTDFIEDFYEDEPYIGNVEKEAVIETVYNNNTVKTSLGKIDIVKKGYTDGWMRFRYTDNAVSFYGLQETKRGVNPTNVQLTKQLIQLIGYYYQVPEVSRSQCLVFCFNSAYFYGYVLLSDIKQIIESVSESIINAGVSASKLYSKCKEANNIILDWVTNNYDKCHIKHLNNDVNAKSFELNKVFREIYLNCL